MTRAVSSFGTLLKMGDGGTTPKSGGASTTLSVLAAYGATSITVTSAVGIVVSDIIRIGTVPNHVLRTVTAVVGSVLSFADSLPFGFANATPVVEVDAEAFATIAEVHDITGPDQSVDMQEVTSHTSPGAFEELIATIKRSGDLTFDCAFVPEDPTHGATAGLQQRYSDRERTNFQLHVPTVVPHHIAFTAYVQKLGLAAPVQGVLMRPVTLKVTGEPDLIATV